MTLQDLLRAQGIAPETVLVMRHRPQESALFKVLPWLAAEHPDVFNAYQQTQGERVEAALQTAKYVASFIGRESGKALFVGLFGIGGTKPLTQEQFWRVPANLELRKHGMRGFSPTEERPTVLWFDLSITPFYAQWKGKLIVSWPPPERSWWRRAHRNEMTVLAILEESALDEEMPRWEDVTLLWEQLSVLRRRGERGSPSGAQSTTSSTRAMGRDTWGPPMAPRTSWADGVTTPREGMAATCCCVSATPSSSFSASFSASRQTWRRRR